MDFIECVCESQSLGHNYTRLRMTDLNDVTCETNQSALYSQQGFLLSLTRSKEAGTDRGLC